LPIVAYWDVAAGGGASLLPLARAGVTDVVTMDVDDGRPRLVELLGATERRGMATWVLTRLAAAGVPAGASAIVRTMLQYSHAPIPVCEIARALGVSRRTLLSRLDAAGLPNPSLLAAWCRVLSAGHLIASTGRAIEGIAAELDFPSGNALRNLIRRHTGLACAALRAGGGLERVLERFMAVLLGDRDDPCAPPREEPRAGGRDGVTNGPCHRRRAGRRSGGAPSVAAARRRSAPRPPRAGQRGAARSPFSYTQ
jgi:AraC-like DNA-binding protein